MLARLSGLLSDVNGKLGGSCFARNHYGLYMKNWQVPYNPQTDHQTTVRDNFKAVCHLWQTITDLQRIGWNALGAGLKRQNKLGEDYTPSGFEVFMSCNQNRFMIGEASLQDAPAIPLIPQCTFSSYMYDPPTGNVSGTLAGGSINSNIYYLVYMTKRFSPGRYYMKFNFVNFGFLDDSTFNWQITFAAYLTRWGVGIIPGYKYFFKFIPIHKPSGFSGIDFSAGFVIPSSLCGIGYYSIGSTFILS